MVTKYIDKLNIHLSGGSEEQYSNVKLLIWYVIKEYDTS